MRRRGALLTLGAVALLLIAGRAIASLYTDHLWFEAMGAHAVDTATPELRGDPFTSTFIYGYYNGRMTFVEPMISTAFLKTKTNFTAPVKQPAAYPRRGYYPTRYSVTYDPKREEYSVALEGLVLRAGVGTPKQAATVARR